MPPAREHEGRSVLGKRQLWMVTEEPRVRVSPRAERQAVCVGAVRPGVVGGGYGVPEQPHPGPDVYVHLAGAQKRLAWVSGTRNHDCLVTIGFGHLRTCEIYC